ncbi:MAG TPA: hypothetical protein ENI05_03855, partial [Porticoccus sp.]|nr:hypothetical protein [Porticoccus sp.]
MSSFNKSIEQTIILVGEQSPRAQFGVLAATGAILIFFLSSAAVASPEPEEVRQRIGYSEPEEIPVYGGEIIQTSTPVLLRNGGVQGELLLADKNDRQWASSGETADDFFVVQNGLLNPGGQYSWQVLQQKKLSVPDIHIEADGATEFGLSASHMLTTEIEIPRNFSVSPSLVTAGSAQGLFARFWSMAGGSESNGLPDELKPSANARIPSISPQFAMTDIRFEACELEKTTHAGGNQDPLTDYTYTTCEVEYGMEVNGTKSLSGAEDDVAFNVEENNVAHNFQATLTASMANSEGFEFSTADGSTVSLGYPLRNMFALRALADIQVPVSGTYRLATRSPGGARVYIYDTTDDDLGKTLVSASAAWAHTQPDSSCKAQLPRRAYKNDLLYSETEREYWSTTFRYIFEYADDDDSWFQPEEDTLSELGEQFYRKCNLDRELLWGNSIELVAGRGYQIAADFWLGITPGRFAIHIEQPDGSSGPLPFAWLTPVESLTDFDRTHMQMDTLNLVGSAFALSGYGNSLASIDSLGNLQLREPDGLGGWNMPTALTNNGEAMGQFGESVDFVVTTAESAMPGYLPPNEVSGSPQFWISTRYDAAVGTATLLESFSLTQTGFIQKNLTVEQLEFNWDINSTVISGGSVLARYDQNGQEVDLTFSITGGFVDYTTGRLQLE